jgi:predicted nucleic acid-binding protein
MAVALIDTGAIVAYLDRNDRWHRTCVEAFRSVRLPLLTTSAVLTEVFHLILRDLGGVDRAWELLDSGAITVASIGDADLPPLRTLMLRYEDRPMDFADATLVHVANREGIRLILSIDHDDFETYRLAGNKKFMILPHRTGK